MAIDKKKGVLRKTLNEQDWIKVFEIRCRSKRGQALSMEDCALVDDAYEIDPTRYEAMEPDVFDETVPFGSQAMAKIDPK